MNKAELIEAVAARTGLSNRAAKDVIDAIFAIDGGIIARHYPQPGDIALPPEFQRVSYEAFLANGCGV